MEDLKELLNKEIVDFTFTKANGEIREARGTRLVLFDDSAWLREITNFKDEDLPKGNKTANLDVITYWDCDKEAWRSLRADSLVSINKIVTIKELNNDIDKEY